MSDLENMTYKALQDIAKKLDIKANFKRTVLIEKIESMSALEVEKATNNVVEPKTNRQGKTPEQKEKDDQACAALAACGRL